MLRGNFMGRNILFIFSLLIIASQIAFSSPVLILQSPQCSPATPFYSICLFFGFSLPQTITSGLRSAGIMDWTSAINFQQRVVAEQQSEEVFLVSNYRGGGISAGTFHNVSGQLAMQTDENQIVLQNESSNAEGQTSSSPQFPVNNTPQNQQCTSTICLGTSTAQNNATLRNDINLTVNIDHNDQQIIDANIAAIDSSINAQGPPVPLPISSTSIMQGDAQISMEVTMATIPLPPAPAVPVMQVFTTASIPIPSPAQVTEPPPPPTVQAASAEASVAASVGI